MTPKRILTLGAIAAAISGCDSGDIKIDPVTSVTDSNNTTIVGGGGSENDVCASYVNSAGQRITGTYDGTNCAYTKAFVDAGNNLLYDMTIPALPDGGAHVFDGSLFVGRNYKTNAALAAAGISQGGDGPRLTIEAGAILAWRSSNEFVVINRGSQINAVGRADAPIMFTSLSDVEGTVGAEDVQQWGGMVINGFGVTNQCAYAGSVTAGDLALAGECHVAAEGAAGLDESHYGGDNDDDSSGVLEYVIVKHTGAEVDNGDELNGITFSGVGRNTLVRNLQVYSTYDDGIEMFGGAVNVDNYVAVYVRDDTLDFDEGYSGTVTNALIIQSQTKGNNCIEADGLSDYSNLNPADVAAKIAQGINTRATVNNMTCILSAQHGNDNPPHGAGAGVRLREGIFATINDSLVISSHMANDTAGGNDNYCLRIDDRSQQAATDGDLQLNALVMACQEPAGSAFDMDYIAGRDSVVLATVPSGTAVNPTAAADTGLQLLEGAPPIYSIPFATSLVDGIAPNAAAAPVNGGAYLGALCQCDTDWTQWAYGIHPGNRAQPLWFE